MSAATPSDTDPPWEAHTCAQSPSHQHCVLVLDFTAKKKNQCKVALYHDNQGWYRNGKHSRNQVIYYLSQAWSKKLRWSHSCWDPHRLNSQWHFQRWKKTTTNTCRHTAKDCHIRAVLQFDGSVRDYTNHTNDLTPGNTDQWETFEIVPILQLPCCNHLSTQRVIRRDKTTAQAQ